MNFKQWFLENTQPAPAKLGGTASWEELTSDPDVNNRIHNHPAGLAKGQIHYNARHSGTGHLEELLTKLPFNGAPGTDLKGIGITPTGDIVLTQEILDKLKKWTGRKYDPSLVGTKLRFGSYKDTMGRGGMVSHIFPPN